MELDNTFKEFHVKVFNTGKLEIPGVQNEVAYNMLLTQVADILRPFITKEPILEDVVMKSPLLHINDEPFGYKENSTETVLINSNFNCGFYIDREALYDILKFKYNIQSIYDPCSYPGIQCKFYYNPEVDLQNGCQITEENIHLYKNINIISFMIFRTGSVLIVGRCDEDALMIIYEFLKIILKREYIKICQKNMIMSENYGAKDKKKKTRRKNITIETEN
jgi:TATA-box binding protein (TBP) (component of TFIID and TFIIIB)